MAEAVRAAESGTAAELVPVVATASGRYDRAEDIVGLLCALTAVSLAWTLFQGTAPAQGAWASGYRATFPLWAVLGVFLAGFWAGTLAATVFPALRRPFVSAREMDEEVERAAQAAFQRLRVSQTRGGTGLLIYVSLFERRVRLLGDAAVQKALSPLEWDQVRDLLLEGIRGQRPGQGLCAALARSGELLSRSFPRPSDDTDELPNDLHIID